MSDYAVPNNPFMSVIDSGIHMQVPRLLSSKDKSVPACFTKVWEHLEITQ